jgi:hypothetical protein
VLAGLFSRPRWGFSVVIGRARRECLEDCSDNMVKAIRWVGMCLVGAVLGLMLTGQYHDTLDARTGTHHVPLAKGKGMSAL